MNTTKILLVEDDTFLREIYTDTLTKAGFVVSTAEDGNEGKEKIKAGDWELLLLDIILPHMDGITILRTLHEDPSFQQQMSKPVIFLTNLDNDNEMKQALELGNGYIIKSQISPGDLLTKINEILQNPAA